MAAKIRGWRWRSGKGESRISIPENLRPLLGKSEFYMRHAGDERQALIAHWAVHDELEAARKKLAADKPTRRPLPLGELAKAFYGEELAIDTAERDYAGPKEHLGDYAGLFRERHMAALRKAASGRMDNEELRATIGWAVGPVIEHGRSKAKPGTPEWRELARTLAAVQLDAIRRGGERDEGEFGGEPRLSILKEPVQPAKAETPCPKLTMTALFEQWEKHPEQARTAPRTKARYKGVFTAVSDFLKNPDAPAVTTDDIRRYVEARMTGPHRLAPRNIRDVHKAALSSVYGWAMAKKFVTNNPATGIVIKVTKARKLRSKSATDDEARQLVAAALTIPDTAKPRSIEAAYRWTSIIALYTGCRIGEVCQIRRQDVIEIDGFSAIRITPGAGTVKDGEVRDVPIHPRLIELGLMRFMEQAASGPLFFDPASRRRADAKTPQSELVTADVAAWGRANGLSDPLLLQPMHALRHRFVTLARRAGIEKQYVTAITGHAAQDQNEEYGEYPIKVLHREISRLKPADVEGRKADT